MKRLAAGLAALLVALGVLIAQEPPEGPLSLFPRGPSLTDAQLSELTDRMARRMSVLRGLHLPGPVAKRVYTPAELRKLFLAKLDEDWPPEELGRWAEAYEALGLLPRGTDLRTVLAAVMTEQLVGAYDPDTKTMYLVKGAPAMILPLVLVHELTHAAQDAHFNLEALPWDQHDNDDLALAVQALLEGDATAVMFDHMAGRDTSTIAELDLLLSSGPELLGSPQLALAPRAVRELLVFPYVAGFRMVSELRRRGGWERVNAAYRDLPLSTEQILHPEKYLDQRDPPQRVSLPEVPPGVVAGAVIQENVLGEFGLRLLLEEFTTTEEAVQAAEGWDGDRFRVWRRGAAGPGGDRSWLIVLVTTWDSPTDAREFHQAYVHLVTNKYRREEEQPTGVPGRRLWRSERGLVEVVLQGSDVVVIEGVGEDEREALWRALSDYGKEEFRWPAAQKVAAE